MRFVWSSGLKSGNSGTIVAAISNGSQISHAPVCGVSSHQCYLVAFFYSGLPEENMKPSVSFLQFPYRKYPFSL